MVHLHGSVPRLMPLYSFIVYSIYSTALPGLIPPYRTLLICASDALALPQWSLLTRVPISEGQLEMLRKSSAGVLSQQRYAYHDTIQAATILNTAAATQDKSRGAGKGTTKPNRITEDTTQDRRIGDFGELALGSRLHNGHAKSVIQAWMDVQLGLREHLRVPSNAHQYMLSRTMHACACDLRACHWTGLMVE